MPFYIRKSVSVGPFRFNLSKSGIGVSAGVKGFRVGTGPRGNYIHMGRGGLYYRHSLSTSKRHQRELSHIAPQEPTIETGGIQETETGDVLEMVSSSSNELIEQINRQLNSVSYWPFVLALGFLAVPFVAASESANAYAFYLAFLLIAVTAVTAYFDHMRGMVVVMYDLDDEAQESFRMLSAEFDRLAQCAQVWNIDTQQGNSDWKRNGGAGALITRSEAQFSDLPPRNIKTNVNTPCIRGGKLQLCFLPDTILVIENKKAGAIAYDDICIQWEYTTFIEDGAVPKDSEIIGYTWQYVNKSGGPDRRFNNNRQIPRVAYQKMTVEGPGNLNKVLHLSQVADRTAFNQALNKNARVVQRMKDEAENIDRSLDRMENKISV